MGPWLILPCLASSACETPHPRPKVAFSPTRAIFAEWRRQPLAEQPGKPLPQDQARHELSLARIGFPGAPELLPPELAHPTREAWEALARKARTPEERFNSLYFLNRFKATDALAALAGLGAADARDWPAHLHLEAQIATARLNGATVGPELQAFLDGLAQAGKVDPVRAQAARLRLVMAGLEKELLPPVPATPGAALALMDSLNRGPAGVRAELMRKAGDDILTLLPLLGCRPSKDPALRPLLAQRLTEGPVEGTDEAWLRIAAQSSIPSIRQSALGYLGKLGAVAADQVTAPQTGPIFQASVLPSLRLVAPAQADALRGRLLAGPSAVARAAAIDDLPAAPGDLDALARRCYQDADLESALELFAAFDRWKLPAERQKALLEPFLRHPDWGWRYQAWLQLRKVEPTAPWPSAPPERPMDKALLAEAARLARSGKPVRLRIAFSGRRTVTLRLDPAVAPMNVANLVLLARKRFFDRRRVPRIVPDFVVQMGSPFDTMDGGPGYSVRCEDSLAWYGPGSVGMALAGKDTGGCQFFITTNATPHLTGKYTRVGEVEDPDRALPLLDALELGARIVSVRVLD